MATSYGLGDERRGDARRRGQWRRFSSIGSQVCGDRWTNCSELPCRCLKRLSRILFWSVITAAFVGPGTVATAASAGSLYGYSLLWSVLVATAACFVLQEACGRLTIVSGLTLGEAMRSGTTPGLRGAGVAAAPLSAVVLGCTAYQAGNILGAVAGVNLGFAWSGRGLILVVGGLAFVLLASSGIAFLIRALGLIVAAMGAAFFAASLSLGPSLEEFLVGSLVPKSPSGSGLIVLAVVGTTVVPYNLFLGSGLARGQRLGEMRFGLAGAIGLGGLITMAILIVGAAVEDPFTFSSAGEVLQSRLGFYARILFACGLFAAGLSSAVTAPLAAAITTRSILAEGSADARWSDTSWRFRAVWVGVLATGVLTALSGWETISVLLVAQALNGLLLPIVAIFLLVAVNDRRLMGGEELNGRLGNLTLASTVAVTLLLGILNLARAAWTAWGRPPPDQDLLVLATAAMGGLSALPLIRTIRSRRAG